MPDYFRRRSDEVQVQLCVLVARVAKQVEEEADKGGNGVEVEYPGWLVSKVPTNAEKKTHQKASPARRCTARLRKINVDLLASTDKSRLDCRPKFVSLISPL